MIELRELIQYIQEILIPIAMISGIGLITLLVQTRYGRVVDSTRHLNCEKLKLFESRIIKELTKVEQNIISKKLENIEFQLNILVKRGKCLKRTLFSLLMAVFAFIFTSLMILLQEMIPSPLLVLITASLFITGLLLLISGGSLILLDLTYSQKAVLIALEGTREIIESFEMNVL